MDIERAKRVQNILNDIDVQNAFDDLEKSAFVSWKSAKTQEERELCWHECQAVSKLRQRLKNYASDLLLAQRGDGK